MCVCVCVHVHMSVCVYVHMSVCVSVCVCVYMCTFSDASPSCACLYAFSDVAPLCGCLCLSSVIFVHCTEMYVIQSPVKLEDFCKMHAKAPLSVKHKSAHSMHHNVEVLTLKERLKKGGEGVGGSGGVMPPMRSFDIWLLFHSVETQQLLFRLLNASQRGGH